MKILIVLIINFILTLLTYMIVLLDSNVPLKNYIKSLKKDIKYVILIYMTFNFGYLIQNICGGGLIYGKGNKSIGNKYINILKYDRIANATNLDYTKKYNPIKRLFAKIILIHYKHNPNIL